jgi:CubicO group peptidase (beta-lactamase class C family)
MAGTAYEGATIRHLLDMRVGVEFEEDYLATKGAMIAYHKATGWQPLEPGDALSDLRSFLQTLTISTGPHGGPVHYVSPNTDLLGWANARATGQRYAGLLSELIWKPLGAERSAYIAVDRLGAPRAPGGMCVTVRDLGRWPDDRRARRTRERAGRSRSVDRGHRRQGRSGRVCGRRPRRVSSRRVDPLPEPVVRVR